MPFYVLKDKIPVPASNFDAGAVLSDISKRRVAETVRDGIQVSTVFLSIDHNYSGKGPPILFETMISGGSRDGYQRRCATWAEAEIMHEQALMLLGWTLELEQFSTERFPPKVEEPPPQEEPTLEPRLAWILGNK